MMDPTVAVLLMMEATVAAAVVLMMEVLMEVLMMEAAVAAAVVLMMEAAVVAVAVAAPIPAVASAPGVSLMAALTHAEARSQIVPILKILSPSLRASSLPRLVSRA